MHEASNFENNAGQHKTRAKLYLIDSESAFFLSAYAYLLVIYVAARSLRQKPGGSNNVHGPINSTGF